MESFPRPDIGFWPSAVGWKESLVLVCHALSYDCVPRPSPYLLRYTQLHTEPRDQDFTILGIGGSRPYHVAVSERTSRAKPIPLVFDISMSSDEHEIDGGGELEPVEPRTIRCFADPVCCSYQRTALIPYDVGASVCRIWRRYTQPSRSLRILLPSKQH